MTLYVEKKFADFYVILVKRKQRRQDGAEANKMAIENFPRGQNGNLTQLPVQGYILISRITFRFIFQVSYS